MEHVVHLLAAARGGKEELEQIKELESQMAAVKEEISELARQERELQALPDRVGPYRRKLEKIQGEIEKQRAIECSVAAVADISSIEKYLTKKELLGKISAYFSTLYRQTEIRLVVDEVKVKARCAVVSREYNQLVELCREKFPEEAESLVAPVVELIVGMITSASQVISVVTKNDWLFFSSAQNKKTALPTGAVAEEVVRRLAGPEHPGESAVPVEPAPLSAVLPQLVIHPEILEGVKRALLRDLPRLSLSALEHYNAQVFYGTVYHLSNADTWLADNLVTQMKELARSEGFSPLSEQQRRELHPAAGAAPATFIEGCAAVMAKQQIASVSAEMFQLLKSLRAVAATERAKSRAVQNQVQQLLAERLNTRPSGSANGVSQLEAAALRLCDAKLTVGLILDAQSPAQPADLPDGPQQLFFAVDEGEFLDALEDAFAGVLRASGCSAVSFQRRDAGARLESLLAAFAATIPPLFGSNLLSHLKAEFFNALFTRAYEALCGDALFSKAPEEWEEMLELLLARARAEEPMILRYREVAGACELLGLKEQGSRFLQAYNEGKFALPKEVVLHLVPALFSDPAFVSIVVSHIEKQHKNE